MKMSLPVAASNCTVNDTQVLVSKSTSTWWSAGRIQIPFYTIILMLAIVGNVLVISTLVQNRRMRTITNVFLLNLAVSDVLLGVLCMPFTLVGTLLRDFVFGEFLCKLLPFLQASSVAVSSWTLVAISCERYYAICHPLRSRSWQTLRHAYKIIGFIWIGSLLCMLPIAGFSQLMPTSQGLRKCREQWPDEAIYYERAYNIFLDLILLVLPLVVLCAAYFLITRTLWKGIRTEKEPKKFAAFSISVATTLQQCQEDSETRQYESQVVQVYPTSGRSSCAPSPSVDIAGRKVHGRRNTSNGHKSPPAILRKQFDSTLRRTNVAKNLQNKQRVIKMLFVLVLEFFICWTPLYVINTIALFNPSMVYQNLGYTAISFFQLLAYSSSCCNPITYCFMNANFRRAFLDTFKGLKSKKRYSLKSAQDGELESPKVATNHS